MSTSSSVVGIDLGYQNSLIAVAGRGGVDVVLNGNTNRLNPYVPRRCCRLRCSPCYVPLIFGWRLRQMTHANSFLPFFS